jgi:predicted transcriptional regulator YdeE
MNNFFAILVIATVGFCSFITGQGMPLCANQRLTGIETPMESYHLVRKEAVAIIGIECRTSNAPEAAPYDIPRHWDKFFREEIFNRIPNKASDSVIALYCDYEGDYTQPYSFVIGCPVNSTDEVPEGMAVKIIPAGPYAVFEAVGEFPQSVTDTWTKVWQQMEPERSYTGDYEIYKDLMATGLPNEIEVVIALKE